MRFSIASLLLFTLGIAVAIVAAQAAQPIFLFGPVKNEWQFVSRISAAIQACGVVWIGFGLLCQARDLRLFLLRNGTLTSLEFATLRFHLLWRLLAVGLLAFSYCLQYWESKWDSGDSSIGRLLLDGTYAYFLRQLIVLIAIGVGGACRSSSVISNRRPWFLDFLGLLAGVLLALFVAFELGTLRSLIYFAINIYEAGMTFRVQLFPMGLELIHAERTLASVSLLQVFVIVCGWIGLFFVARRAEHIDGAWPRYGWMIPATCAGLGLLIHALVFTYGLPSISNNSAMPWLFTPSVAQVLILAIAILYAATRLSTGNPPRISLVWRSHPATYLHERRAVLATIFGACLAKLLTELTYSVSLGRFQFQNGFPGALLENLVYPENFPTFALLQITARKLYCGRIAEAEANALPTIDQSRWWKRTALLALLGIATAETLRTWSLAVWLW